MTYQKFNDKEDNKILIGIKPLLSYATALTYQFKTKGYNEVTLLARGKFINKAVDVFEFTKRTFLKNENIKIKEVKINSVEYSNNNTKKPIFISIIEIVLVKGGL